MSIHHKSGQKPAPLLRNSASSPFVFFDGAPCFGVMNNVVEIELSASAVTLVDHNQTRRDMVSVAHLKGSVEAGLNLYVAIGRALQMAKVPLPELAPATPDANGLDDDLGDDDLNLGSALSESVKRLNS